MSSGKQRENLDSVLNEIDQGIIKPLYLLYGEEAYLVCHARKKLVETLKRVKRIPAEESVDPAAVTPAELVHQLRSPSLFNPFQILVAANADWFGNRRIAAAEPLKDWAVSPATGSTAVITVESVDRRLGVIRAIKKHGTLLAFEKVKSYDQGNIQRDVYYPIVRDRLRIRRQTMDPEAWQHLRQLTPDNLWAVINSVDVVSCYAGTRTRISAADVDACIHDHTEMPGYMILDAMGQRNPRKLLACIEKILNGGMHGLQLNKTVSRRVRALLLCHALKLDQRRLPQSYMTFKNRMLPKITPAMNSHPAAAGVLGEMNPYALFMLLKQSPLFKTPELVKCLSRLETVDLQLKSGTTAARRWLESALLPLCRSGGNR